jgi:hypothetical protein
MRGMPMRGGEFRRGPGRGPAAGPGGPPLRDDDRRFRELEEKMNRILKELDEMKARGEKGESSSKTEDATD